MNKERKKERRQKTTKRKKGRCKHILITTSNDARQKESKKETF